MIVFNTKTRDAKICQLYESRKFTTEQIADEYGIKPRTVQKIVERAGIIRSHAEAQRVASKLRRYHRIPTHLKKQRQSLSVQSR
jgi:DNA-binding transcriptional regulator LsrR (DeoR family)